MRKSSFIIPAAFSMILLFSCSEGNEKVDHTKVNDSTIAFFHKKKIDTNLLKIPAADIRREFRMRTDISFFKEKKQFDPRLAKFSTKKIYEYLDVVYGEDNRQNRYEQEILSDASMMSDVEKVACVVYRSQLHKTSGGEYEFGNVDYFTSVSGQALCTDEKFYGEPTVAFCTAFAIDSKLMVSAGHCFTDVNLNDLAFVYGYYMKDADHPNMTFPTSDIYYPVKIKKSNPGNNLGDFSLIELNRSVSSNRIATVRTAGKISENDQVHVIGFPCGLPIKVTKYANILDNSDENFFKTNLDTYHGNSGSPVFNSVTHVIEGILVDGEDDFEVWDLGQCYRSKICLQDGSDCRGESVSRISQFWPMVNSFISKNQTNPYLSSKKIITK